MVIFNIFSFFVSDFLLIFKVFLHLIEKLLFFLSFMWEFSFEIWVNLLSWCVISNVYVVLGLRADCVLISRSKLLPLTTIVVVIWFLTTLLVLWMSILLLCWRVFRRSTVLLLCFVIIWILYSRPVSVDIIKFFSLLMT